MAAVKPLKILKASAGSGKTFSLAAHYLTLLFNSEFKYREILAVTFTNKATEEMKSRILEVLKGFAEDDSSPAIESYRAILRKAYPQLSPPAFQARADSIYRRILHDYSRFSVSTIDGFVQKVIRSFAFELGLDASYALEMNLEKVKENLVERLDKELDKKPILVQWIIELAKERIENDKGWNYKTELLTLTKEIFKERFADFERALEHIGHDHIDQTFSDYAKNTRSFIRQVETLTIEKAALFQEQIVASGLTTSDMARKSQNPLLKMNKVIEKDFSFIDKLSTFVDEPDSWFQKTTDPTAYASLNPLLKDLCSYYKAQESDYILAIQFQKNVYYLRLMQELAFLLKAYRDDTGNLLISDAQNLLSGITEDAGENPSFIWEKIGNRYKNFLFDEFQDTSVAQWNSFKSLVSNALSEPSEELIDHLIVGDTKQSIYRWRNGDWNILESGAKQDLGAYHIMDDNLEENYRSSTEIIAFNNRIYNEIPEIIQSKLTEAVDATNNPSLLAWWVQQGYHKIITQIYTHAQQKTTNRTAVGGVLKLKKFTKPEDEDRMFSDSLFREYALADSIAEILHMHNSLAYAYQDICVLVRTNGEALEVVNGLMAQGIPVVSGDALMIANNSAIQLLINSLYVLVGYQENTSLYKANCIALYHRLQGKEIDPVLFLDLQQKSLAQLKEVLPAALCTSANEWLQLPLPELVEQLIKAYGLDNMSQHLAYLLAFRDIAANATKQGEKGILSFLSWWEEDGIRKTLPSPDQANAVQVMTIHKSKGLAFRAVLMPFCTLELAGKSDSIFWVPAANTNYKALYSIPLKYNAALAKSSVATYYFEENLYSHIDALNMIYVATTRAKDYLYIGLKYKKELNLNKLSNTGDLLQLVFKDEWDDDDCYKVEQPIHSAAKAEEKQQIQLNNYPTSSRLSTIYDPLEERHLNHVLHTNEASRLGTILHELLAHSPSPAAVETALEDFILQGVIAPAEKEKFWQEALAVLAHSDLQALFAGAAKQWAEKTIISPQGNQYRPDNVLVYPDKIVVLDYKFTFEASAEHISQVQHYMVLLREMGYANVEGYLFYALTKKLQPVY